MFFRKTISFILPVCIWISINIYVFLFRNLISPLFKSIADNASDSNWPWLIALLFLINAACQILIVSLLTSTASKKLEYSAKHLAISIPILLLLFAIYNQPFVYLFVDTDEWGFFFTHHRQMPSWKASFYITVQYGIVMLITKFVIHLRSNSKS